MKKVGSMAKKDEEDEEEKDKKDDYKSVKKEDFIFPDLKTAYMYWRNFLPENTYQRYIAAQNCVIIGKSLLYIELLKCEDAEKKQIYNDVVKKAKETLKKAIPSKREIGFLFQDFAGKKYPVYKMTAKDAGESHSREDEFGEAQKNFRDQQYESCIRELQETDDAIQDILTENDIIPGFEPRLDELMIKLMRLRFQGKLDEYIRRMKKDAVSS